MSRLIDADALIDKYGDWYTEEGDETGYIGTIKGIVNMMPTIEERKKGKWIQDPKSKRYCCDQCLSFALKTDDMQENLSDFCPVCGSYNGGEQP